MDLTQNTLNDTYNDSYTNMQEDADRASATNIGLGRPNVVSDDEQTINFSNQSINDIENILQSSDSINTAADFLYLSESRLVEVDTNNDNQNGIKLNHAGELAQQVVITLIQRLHVLFCLNNNLDMEEIWTPEKLTTINYDIKLLSKREFTQTRNAVYRDLAYPKMSTTVGLNYVYRMLQHIPRNNVVPGSTYTFNVWSARNIFGIWTFEHFNRSKIQREANGINSVTVVTAPGPFSCPMDCYYCPNQPGQPRSYLKTEPAVARANRNKFDPVWQLWERCSVLLLNTGRTDKLEVIILGGTWSGYDEEYRTTFIRQLYYAANTFYAPKRRQTLADNESGVHYPYVPNREPMSLAEEIERNARGTNVVKIIGLSIETRPDWITPAEIRLLRQYNVTRVQMGIQHTDNRILRKINRGCTVEDAYKAMKLLLDNGFKVLVHYMPDLPGTTPEKDIEMFQNVFRADNELLQADEVKIYPTTVTPYTVIEKWFNEGKYKPMSETDLSMVLEEAMLAIPPWVRADRIIRDIPTVGEDENNQRITYILGGLGGTNRPDYRNVARGRLRQQDAISWDIREREPNTNPNALAILNRGELELVVRSYRASGGTEVFITYESPNEHTVNNPKWLYGLCRLRLPDPQNTDAVFPILKGNLNVKQSSRGRFLWSQPETITTITNGCAIIRQLKAHGQLEPLNKNPYQNSMSDNTAATQNLGQNVQHRGLGKRLLGYAVITARQYGYTRLAVIAGVGVRKYYKKLGFKFLDVESQMLVMDLTDSQCTQYLENYFYESLRQNTINTAQQQRANIHGVDLNMDQLIDNDDIDNNQNDANTYVCDELTRMIFMFFMCMIGILLIWILARIATTNR